MESNYSSHYRLDQNNTKDNNEEMKKVSTAFAQNKLHLYSQIT